MRRWCIVGDRCRQCRDIGLELQLVSRYFIALRLIIIPISICSLVSLVPAIFTAPTIWIKNALLLSAICIQKCSCNIKEAELERSNAPDISEKKTPSERFCLHSKQLSIYYVVPYHPLHYHIHKRCREDRCNLLLVSSPLCLNVSSQLHHTKISTFQTTNFTYPAGSEMLNIRNIQATVCSSPENTMIQQYSFFVPMACTARAKVVTANTEAAAQANAVEGQKFHTVFGVCSTRHDDILYSMQPQENARANASSSNQSEAVRRN